MFKFAFFKLEDMETDHCLVRSSEDSASVREEEFNKTVTPKTDGAVTFLAPGVSLPVGTGLILWACLFASADFNTSRKAWEEKTGGEERGRRGESPNGGQTSSALHSGRQ